MEEKIDFARLRKLMVASDIEGRGIKDAKVLNAFLKVPREKFVPEEYRKHAYDDSPLPIGQGQTISQPYMVALMTELLDVEENMKVLEISKHWLISS